MLRRDRRQCEMTREITDMPRDQYVERCKQQALYYLGQGDLVKAVASIVTDCFSNISATSAAFNLNGGYYVLSGVATFGGGSIADASP